MHITCPILVPNLANALANLGQIGTLPLPRQVEELARLS